MELANAWGVIMSLLNRMFKRASQREVLEPEELRRRVNALKWFHSIDFGNGVVSPGMARLDMLQTQANVYFNGIIEGKTFLDIGCWDGFNSVEAHRRGASRVLATDHYVWHGQWGNRACFDLAHKHAAPEIEVMDIDLPDLLPKNIGTFDIVLFAGVFYHLRNPFMMLEQVSKLANEWLIVETAMDAMEIDRPAMIFYPGAELSDDDTNWWGPNPACVIAMLKDVGFPKVEYTNHPVHPSRGIFRASR